MKRVVLLILVLAFSLSGMSQNQQLKSGIKTEKAPWLQVDKQQNHRTTSTQNPKINIPGEFKNKDAVNIVTLGSSGNAYGIGFAGYKPAVLHYNNDLNTIVFIHQMGGELDPGGYTGNLGYDISTDGGQTWSLMNLLYTAEGSAGGGYFLDAARYPQVGVYNPPANTNPDDAYVAFGAGLLDSRNLNGIVYGRGSIGDITDTTRNFLYSDPGQGIFMQERKAFTLNDNGDIWIINPNTSWEGGALEWLEELVVNKLTWNETELDFVLEEQYLIDCPTEGYPADIKIEFSPDGNIGYVAVLGNIEDVSAVDSVSYYPIIWRTEDAGETWEGPVKVALAGENGILGVQNFLSDDELAELYDPVPPRDEIPFTTAFDFDLTVDYLGNPAIAVIAGITGNDPFSVITDISQSSGYMFTDAFLLHSTNKGEPGSWFGHEMGRPVSFRGTFGDFGFTEDNRIQVSRTPAGDYMLVAWLDTDTAVAAENNAPDIWARGIDLLNNTRTLNENAEDRPFNVTFGSEGTFSAYFFAMSNVVPWTEDSLGFLDNFTIPMVYVNMTPTDPAQPVMYKYIQNFDMNFGEFIIPNVDEETDLMVPKVSGPMPNPATSQVELKLSLQKPANASLALTNLMGQTVKQIRNRQMSAGTNQIKLDVSDLGSGIYFITIEAAGEKVSRKLVVE